MKYFENNQNVTQKHKVNKRWQKNAADRLMVGFLPTLICKKKVNKTKHGIALQSAIKQSVIKQGLPIREGRLVWAGKEKKANAKILTLECS